MKNQSTKIGSWTGTVLLMVVLLILPLQACTPTSPQEFDVVKVSVLPYVSYGGLIIAQDEGYFTDENLAVEFVRLEDASQAIPMLIGGDIDVSGAGLNIGLLNAIADGKVKIVADRGYLAADGCTYMALLASPAWVEEYNASPVEALTGARVSIDVLNFEGFILEQVLSEHGLTLADIIPTDISPPSLIDAVTNNSIDIISIGEPWLTRLMDSGLVTQWKLEQDIAPDIQFGMIVFGPTLLVDRPDVGERFIKAYLKGVEQYNKGTTERNVEILAEYTGLDVELLQRACWPPMHADGIITTDTIDAYQAWVLSNGLIENILPVSEYWDPIFVEAVGK
jgi:NitT/TauT family transport system substrate-binding protein